VLRIGRYLERQGLRDRDAKNGYLTGDDLEAGPMEKLLGSWVMCMDARMSRAQDAQERPPTASPSGRRSAAVCTLSTLPACDEPFDDGVGEVAGFSLHAGVVAGRINVESSIGCVGISAGRRSRRSLCRSRRTAKSGIS